MKKIGGVICISIGVILFLPTIIAVMKLGASIMSILFNHIDEKTVTTLESILGTALLTALDVFLFSTGAKLLKKKADIEEDKEEPLNQ